MSRIKYQSGDVVGDYGLTLVKRLQDNPKKATFLCPHDNQEFDAYISNVKTGKTKSCGCITTELISEKKQKDITGQKFGNLTALYPTGKTKNGHKEWHCKCDCGNEIDVVLSNLTSGNTQTCGDLNNCLYAYLQHSQSHFVDIQNKRFGKLVAKEPVIFNNKLLWRCECDCGEKEYYAPVKLLNSGNTKSCGCLVSKGELALKQMFIEHNIAFEQQATIEGCKHKRLLRFDFYLPSYGCYLEYNGIQHYEARGGWNTPEQHEYTKILDNIKYNFCKEHNLPLVIISYKEEITYNNIIRKIYEAIGN